MEIIVTKHAIEQYKNKMFSKLDDTEISKILEIIVKKGKYDNRRPGDAFTMAYNGIKIVAAKDGDRITVITCLGNKRYSRWALKNEIMPRYRKSLM